MMYSKILTTSTCALILILLSTPALTETDKPLPDMKIMGSVLSQADYYRIRGKTPQQLKQAISLYEQAANQDSVVAQYWLGRMYFEGKGTDVDKEKAEEWLDLAAKQDYQPAKEFLFDIVLADSVTDDEC